MTEPTARPDRTTAWVRRAGRLTDPDGRARLWTVAEGGRGRRWRERWTADDGAIALLLELDPEGSWRKLELAGPGGLLTLHPEPDAAMVHGNLVGDAGIRHVAMTTVRDPGLHVVGSLATAAVLAAGLGARIRVGERGRMLPGILVGTSGDVVSTVLGLARPAPDEWTIEAAGVTDRIILDAAGLPTADGAASWPLELDVE